MRAKLWQFLHFPSHHLLSSVAEKTGMATSVFFKVLCTPPQLILFPSLPPSLPYALTHSLTHSLLPPPPSLSLSLSFFLFFSLSLTFAFHHTKGSPTCKHPQSCVTCHLYWWCGGRGGCDCDQTAPVPLFLSAED